MRRLANRNVRQQTGRFLVEGPQAVREAVMHRPDAVDEVFVVPNRSLSSSKGPPAAMARHPGAGEAVAGLAAAAGLRVAEVPEPVLLAMTETVHPQGVAAVARFVHRELDGVLTGAGLVAVLHDVRDPGNAGTILRSADAAGADAVIFTGDSVDPYNGKCVRSTAGSLFHVPFAIEPSVDHVLAACRRHGITAIAAAADAEESLPDPAVRELLSSRIAWVFGNEAHGLPDDVQAATERSVAIPIYGSAESLNLAAAAAVALYTTAFTRLTA